MGDEKRTFKKKDMPIRRLHDTDEELEQPEQGEFADMFQDSLRQPQSGEVVKGVVVQIEQDVVLVDVGYKSEGCIRIGEFIDEAGELQVKVGDEVNVYFERGENIRGHMVLSKKKADSQVAWEAIAAAGEGGVIEGKITGKVKGGMTVDVGVEAFLPASQVDLRPGGNMDRFIGQTYQFKILKLNRKRGNLVLSRRALLEEDRDKARTETLATLKEGDIVAGVVKNIAEYGAFVDLGGVDGLLHVTDMSWGRLGHPSEMVKVGDTLNVMVLKYDREKGKISLGLKQTVPDPWLNVGDRYQEGERVTGKVVSLTDYGAFISLEDGIEGLVHVSEMSWTRRVRHPSELLKTGEEVEAVILGVDPGNRRISLGLKQTEVNPWTVIGERYPVGTKIEGQIKNITDFGVFIGIEDGIDGLVHVSNLSWTKRVKHPSEVLKKGDKVKAMVLAIEPDNRRLSLGVKQLQPDVWESFFENHHIGDVVHGKVLRVATFGAFVEIADGVEGLCHNSEATDAQGHPLKLEPGQEFDFKVLKMNPGEKKVGLSLRAVGDEASRQDIESYRHPASSSSSSTTTLGEMVNWKRAGNDNQ